MKHKGDRCQSGDKGSIRGCLGSPECCDTGEERQTSGNPLMVSDVHYFRCIGRSRPDDLSGRKQPGSRYKLNLIKAEMHTISLRQAIRMQTRSGRSTVKLF